MSRQEVSITPSVPAANLLKLVRPAPGGGLRFSPLWEDEAVVFDPASTQIFVVTESAAHLLKAMQAHSTPVPVADLAAELETNPRFGAEGNAYDAIESMLVELERLGLVESALP